jgi:hypothetical protein
MHTTQPGSDDNGESLIGLLRCQSESLSLSSQSQCLSRIQGANPFHVDWENLGSLIDSGNREGVKRALSDWRSRMQSPQGLFPVEEDPLASEFSVIGTALGSGDVTPAKQVWKKVQSKLEDVEASPKPSGMSSLDPMKADMDRPVELIASTDMSGAQSGNSQHEMDTLIASLRWSSYYFPTPM